MKQEANRSSQPIFPVPEELTDQATTSNKHHQSCSWKITGNQVSCELSSTDISKEDSDSSNNSFLSSMSSSSDLSEDASSPSSTSSSSSSNGPLFELSDLMAQLPIKRGLSMFYQGKSQSFTSLARVESLEDLAKRENPYNKRLKLCRSYCYSPKGTISKKASSRCPFSSKAFRRKNNRISNYPDMSECRTPSVPAQGDF